jgi:hypothetical protein
MLRFQPKRPRARLDAVPVLTPADRDYIRADYFTLDELCAGREESPGEIRGLIARELLPAPSYVVEGLEFFPADYFVLPDQAGGPERLREHFDERYRAAGGDETGIEEDWRGYIEGIYGVCLEQVLPETIIRKEALVVSLTGLLERPEPDDPSWRARLRREVWELDALEREFAPDYDRSGRFPRPPTRDRLIRAARERYGALLA